MNTTEPAAFWKKFFFTRTGLIVKFTIHWVSTVCVQYVQCRHTWLTGYSVRYHARVILYRLADCMGNRIRAFTANNDVWLITNSKSVNVLNKRFYRLCVMYVLHKQLLITLWNSNRLNNFMCECCYFHINFKLSQKNYTCYVTALLCFIM